MGKARLTRERLFLNLGTRPHVLDIDGLAEANPMIPVEALDLGHLPDHLLVLGGGNIGLELAQAFRRFGSQVPTIAEGLAFLLSDVPSIPKS